MDRTPKWRFYKHTNNYSLIKITALEIKNGRAAINQKDRLEMRLRLEALNKYKSRVSNRKTPLDAMNHRINTLKYFMFGYEVSINKQKSLMFSPLGNLFFKYIDNLEASKKIFATMLYAMQFPHPANKQEEGFELYPFRLIYKLLLDDRLNNKLYDFEIITEIVLIKSINEKSYEDLVNRILKTRDLSIQEKKEFLKCNEYDLVATCYEWEYYIKKIMSQAGVIESQEGEVICKLYHPTKPNSVSKKTGRKATTGSFSLSESVSSLISNLLDSEDKFDSEPILFSDGAKLTEDHVKEIYSYYPKELLLSLGIADSNEIFETEIMDLPKLINEYSLNPNNKKSDLFEDVLCDAFNLFINVEAKKLSGPGRTDIECIHLKENTSQNEKFAVDAKSTSTKLMQLSAGRLAHHRDKIGAEYTLIITPRYVPAVLQDIKGQGVYIIKASTFSEYIYNHLNLNIRNIDYNDIYDLLLNSKDNDLSDALSRKTIEKFATMA